MISPLSLWEGRGLPHFLLALYKDGDGAISDVRHLTLLSRPDLRRINFFFFVKTGKRKFALLPPCRQDEGGKGGLRNFFFFSWVKTGLPLGREERWWCNILLVCQGNISMSKRIFFPPPYPLFSVQLNSSSSPLPLPSVGPKNGPSEADGGSSFPRKKKSINQISLLERGRRSKGVVPKCDAIWLTFFENSFSRLQRMRGMKSGGASPHFFHDIQAKKRKGWWWVQGYNNTRLLLFSKPFFYSDE